MCALKREQARREWESELRHLTHSRLYCTDREKVGHEFKRLYNWLHFFPVCNTSALVSGNSLNLLAISLLLS